MEDGELESKRKTPVLKWSEVAKWDNVYDPDIPPPVFVYPQDTVSRIMLNMTLSEPTTRGGPPLLRVIHEAQQRKEKGQG